MTAPPPDDVDAGVWRVLHEALATHARVSVWLHGDPARGRPVRELSGRPVRFDLDLDGQVRVALGVAEGTEQRVVVARIARAVIAAEGPATEAPTAVLLTESLLLRDPFAAALTDAGFRVESLALQDASSAALAEPSLVALIAAPHRAEATLRAAHSVRQCVALAETPLLVAALAHWDVAPGFRRLSRVRVLIAPFDGSAVRAALSDLGVTSLGA